MLRHFNRVHDIAAKYGFRVMLWSDMFFRLATGGDYYAKDCKVDPAIREALPGDVSLIYWDYYNEDKALYDAMFEKHREMADQVIFAGGVGRLRAHFPRCCMGAGLDAFLCLDEPQFTPGNPKPGKLSVNPVKYLFYQDPMCGLFDAHVDPATYPAHFAACAQALIQARANTPQSWRYLFDTLIALCGVLEQKCSLGLEIRAAYEAGDTQQLKQLAASRLPALKKGLEHFLQLFHKQWLAENRVFGLDVIDLRVGGLMQRIDTAAQRISAYVNGELPSLEELEVPLLPYEPGTQGRDLYVHYWHRMVSVSDLSAN